MAEIELSVLSRQCLGHRMEEIENLNEQCKAWLKNRKAHVKQEPLKERVFPTSEGSNLLHQEEHSKK